MDYSFNLIDEPWVPCIYSNNKFEKLSLAQTLMDSPNIRDITAELPTVQMSLYRLFAVILHRNFGPSNYPQWKHLYSQGEWDKDILSQYFAQWHDRFDIFHPKKPFYQFPELSNLALIGINKLIPTIDSGNNVLYNTHSLDSTPLNLAPDIVARYLINIQNFDACGLATSGVASCKTPSCKAPPASKGLNIMFKGRSLFETLLFNMGKYTPNELDIPIWEQDLILQENMERTCNGLVDYLTFPNRGIWIEPNEYPHRMVRTPGYQCIYGDDPYHILMEDKKTRYILKPDINKKSWRDLDAICNYKKNQTNFLANAITTGFLPLDATNCVNVISYSYKGNAKIEFITSENYMIPSKFLSEDQDNTIIIKSLIEIAEDRYRKLLDVIKKCGNKEDSKKNKLIRKRITANLDQNLINYWEHIETMFIDYIQSNNEDLIAWESNIKKIAIASLNKYLQTKIPLNYKLMAQISNDFDDKLKGAKNE